MNPAPETFLDTDKSLACVHCGLCLGACPTYLETGNENDSPRGRIYLMRGVQEGRMSIEEAREHIDLCLGCRACEVACPSGVEYGALLESTRDHLESHARRPLVERLLRRVVIERIFPSPERTEVLLKPAVWLRKLGAERWLPGFVSDGLKLIPPDLSRAELPVESPAIGLRRGRVGFVSGCVMSVMFGRTHRSSVKLLNLAGYDVIVPKEQGCCGALHAHGGRLEAARTAARQNVRVFAEEDLDAIIINAAGCGSTLKEYGHLLDGDPDWRAEAGQFSAKVRDLSEFLVSHGFVDYLLENAESRAEGKVTFHDACHLAHPQGIKSEPRDLVRAVAGDGYVELPEADVCCGSAGSYNLTEPEMAARLQRRKVEHILETGADTVVTTNPGCLLQIQAGLEESAGPGRVRALHLADYLMEALKGGD